MSIKDVFTPYLDNHRKNHAFAPNRDITESQRVKFSSSAAALVEELFMRMPRGTDVVEICHGESMMLRESFEQIVIDLVEVRDNRDIEAWRKLRIESLERLSNLINGMVAANLLLHR